MAKHLERNPGRSMEIWESQFVQQIAPMDQKNIGGMPCTTSVDVSLLSAAGKICVRILLNRLSSHITIGVVPETQCSFRSNRNIVDMHATTPGKVHRARSTSVYCLCQLHKGIIPLGGLDYGSC